MRKTTLFLAISLLLSGYSVSKATTGLQPATVWGPYCETGSKIERTFNMYIDRNGDGVYDYIMIASCNGTITGHNWNPSIGQGNQDHQWTVPIGGPFRAELTSQQCESNIYSWNLSFVDIATNNVACTISGNCAGQISSTCELISMLPPTTGDRQSDMWEKIFGSSATVTVQPSNPWQHGAITISPLPNTASSNQVGFSAQQPAAKPNVE